MDKQSHHRIMTMQRWSKITSLATCKFWIFRPPQELISNYFFMILLALIIFYKTNKFAKLYYDQISTSGVMVVKISLKKSIFPIFGTYPYFKFLPWLQILSIRFLRCISTHKHQIPRYLELPKCRDRFVLTQYFPPFSSFWAMLPIFESDYLDNHKR